MVNNSGIFQASFDQQPLFVAWVNMLIERTHYDALDENLDSYNETTDQYWD